MTKNKKLQALEEARAHTYAAYELVRSCGLRSVERQLEAIESELDAERAVLELDMAVKRGAVPGVKGRK